MGLYNVKIDQEEWTHPMGAAKTLATSKGLYSHRNIITKISPECLSFSLTFTAMDKPFTPLRIREIFSYFDVDDFKKLSFSSNPDFYYNVFPMTSATDLHLYCGDLGYFTIDFVCDSAYGYIDREYNFSYNYNGVFEIYNESNVRNEYGNYLVFPTIEVNMKKGTHFGICPQYTTPVTGADGTLQISETYNWLRLVNLDYAYNSDTDIGLKFTIDNLNKQIYNNTTNENLLEHIYKQQYNFVGLQEGFTYLYREKLVSDEELDFDITIKASYPVIM